MKTWSSIGLLLLLVFQAARADTTWPNTGYTPTALSAAGTLTTGILQGTQGAPNTGQLTATGGATISFSFQCVASDNVTWVTVPMTAVATQQTVAPVASASADGQWLIPIGTYNQCRVNVASVTGTETFTLARTSAVLVPSLYNPDNGAAGNCSALAGAVTGTCAANTFSPIAADSVLANATGGSAAPTAINLGQDLAFVGGVLDAVNLTITSSQIAVPSTFWNPNYFASPASGVVTKLNRVMVGEAALSGENTPQTPADWLETIIPNTTSSSQIVAVSTIGELGLTGATRTSDFRTWAASASGGAQGINGFGFNDDTGSGNPIAVGATGSGFRYASVTGETLGATFQAANGGSVVDITPFTNTTSGSTVAVLAQPGLYTGFSSSISADYVIGGNGNGTSPYARKGIVAINAAFDPSLGSGGKGVVFESADQQSFRWMNSSSGIDAEIWGDTPGLVSSNSILIKGGAGSYTIPSGSIWLSGGIAPTAITAGGAYCRSSGSNGLLCGGSGSGNDWAITDSSLNVFLAVPHGTHDLLQSGTSSGAITFHPQAAAGTYNFNLPITAGSSGSVLTSAGGGSSPMTWTPFSATLSGTTASIGGSPLLAGACAAGTATVTGATSAMVASASPSSDPDSTLSTGIAIYAFVSSTNTVTVRVCAIVAVTPTATTYNVRVLQ